MSYLALYRKYRPNSFNDVIGQDTTVKILKNSIIKNKIGHAYIFCGPRGTGKTTVAKIMARAVNCLNPQDGNLCGKCDNCLNLLENDTDIIEIDAASNNGVEDIREIINTAKLMPNIGKYKVYIIDEVHMLSTGAFNAMLKTLEEPPAHVIFILATTEVQKIPVTILSRCQKFDFHKINDDVLKLRIKKILKDEKKSLNENILDLIVKLSDGCARDAINLLDQILSSGDECISEDDIYNLSGDIPNKKIRELIDSAIRSDYTSGLDLIDEINNSGKNLNIIVNKMLIEFRNLNVYKYKDSNLDKDALKWMSSVDIPDDLILEATKLLLELLNELKKSTMQKLIFEIYFMKLCNILSGHSKVDIPDESANIENIIETSTTIEKNSKNEIESLKQIRINNVMSSANKELKIKIKKAYSDIEEYASNKSFNNAYSILKEGEVVVVSSEYIMLSFEYDSTISLFEKNIIEVENLLKKVLKSNYKVVAVSNKEWKEIVDEYKKNKSKFKYTKEEVLEGKKEIASKKVEDESVFDIFGEENVIIN